MLDKRKFLVEFSYFANIITLSFQQITTRCVLFFILSCVELPCKPDVRWLPAGKPEIKTRSKTSRDEDNTSSEGLLQKNGHVIAVYF